MKYLIYNTQVFGHHIEYVCHLIEYITKNDNDEDIYYFIVHPDFIKKISDIKLEFKTNIFIKPIFNNELNNIESKNIYNQIFNTYKLIKKYAQNFAVDHVIILDINILQLPLSLFRTSFTISGILFAPYFRMQRKKIKDKIRYWRKIFLIKLLIKNTKLKQLFILNDEKNVEYLNKKYKCNLFRVLPDPIPILSPIKNFNLHKEYNIEYGRKIFLHFGAFSERKGVLEIIDSATYLPLDIQKKICFLLVGKARDNFEKIITQKIKSQISEVQFIRDNSFVSTAKMKSVFDNCYCILAPYKNPESSSGILGHAIASNKMIITCDAGLTKEIVENLKIGITTKADSKSIAEAIFKTMDFKYSYKDMSSYIQNYTPEIFSKTLLSKKNKSNDNKISI